MDWWHMALNIQPSSDSSASSSSKSSSRKPSTGDLFAQDMKATAAKHAKQPAPPPKPSKPASTAKPKHADDSSDSQGKRSSSASNSSAAGSKPKAASSASQAAANAQSGQDGSAADDAAAASEANTVANGAKGRAPARTAPKSAGSQDVAAKNAADGSTDPSTDSTNQSGLSLLQLLAKSLQSDDTDTAATDAAAPAATDKTGADGTDKTSDDPNAIALAMFSQALAAALARQQSPTTNAATGDATTGITSATQSPGGAASMQDLMTVLAHNVAADAKGKSDDGAAQFNVDPAKGAASDANATDPAAMGPNALAHLGVASHFAAQHLRNDTNTADLKSPVGSPAWQDEVGTHLTWMAQKGLETGSLRVSPEHLGPVEVNISVQNGAASVWFAANHPDTRAALEQALPRLREMFANQGMNLADSGVSRQSLSQQESRNQSRSGASQGVTGVSAVGGPDASSSSARINLGLVDLYA
jgi:flagellar hook-length control protein FliK